MPYACRRKKGEVRKRIAEATGRLLVVHSHGGVLRGLAAWISHVPQIQLVGISDSCEYALDIAAELHPDLVLIGYSTPKMVGIEATRRLIAMKSDTRILLIGASYDPGRRVEARESGAMDYVLLEPSPQLAATLRGLVNE
jgi:DNA-binding NarL/FixJ family response regulator